jgi:ubiquinone/menaquinone biosynthesis C-methylase UbiE
LEGWWITFKKAISSLCRGGAQRGEQPSVGWAPFDELADRYDQWFDSEKGHRIFRVEAECVRDLLVYMPRPWLEVGVGTGRFAAALDIDEGVDPSPAVLSYAAQRGIRTEMGEAEALPYGTDCFGIVLLVVTFCFLRSPARALSECRRVLRREGHLVVGLVPKDSPWGRAYAAKGLQGHPFYSAASFYTCEEAISIAQAAGLVLEDARSCLVEEPDANLREYELPREGIVPGAGFVCMRFKVECGPD